MVPWKPYGHYILIGNKSYDDKIILNGVELKTNNEEKQIGVSMDKNLSPHKIYVQKGKPKKISALARLRIIWLMLGNFFLRIKW